MKYKVITNETYSFLVNASIIQFIAIIVIISYLGVVQTDCDKMERDLKATTQKHNDKNHKLNECENKIIQGTCLTRMPTYQEAIGG